MEELQASKILILGLIGLQYLSIPFLVIAAIWAVVQLIRKKKTFKSYIGPVIFVVLAGIFYFGSDLFMEKALYNYVDARGTYENELAVSKDSYAEKDEDGNIYFRIGDFSFKDKDGNTIDNSTLAEYKYTVINLWEPWCEPCKGELPDLEKLYEDYHDKGINMIGVHSEEENADQVIKDNGLTYPTVLVDEETSNSLFEKFSAGGIPLTFVLDSEGKLVDVGVQLSEYESLDENTLTEEAKVLYSSVACGPRTYEYWAEKLDKLLG